MKPTRLLPLTLAGLVAACSSAETPTIDFFTSTAASVPAGSVVTLNWAVSDADSVTITAVPGGQLMTSDQANGSLETPPLLETTTFRLDATNGEGTVSAMVSVTVEADGPTPTIDSFTAMPMSVDAGSDVTLTWATTNADTVDIDNGVVTGGDPSGSIVVNPTAPTTYTLTARGPGGTATETVMVQITGVPTVAQFDATPPAITVGGTSTLNFVVAESTGVTIADSGANVVFTGAELTGSVDVSPAATETYTLTAVNDNTGLMATRDVTVTVNPPGGPQINEFIANPATVNLGQSSDLEWNVTGASLITISAAGVVTASSADAIGSFTVYAGDTTEYTLVATDPGGGPDATAVTTLTVNAGPAVILDFDAAPNPIALGDSTSLSWTSVGGESLRILLDGAEIYTTTTTVDGGTFGVTPVNATAVSYVLEVTNALGTDTATSTVYVQDAPFIKGFDVDPITFTGNSTVATISWAAFNVSAIDLQQDGTSLPGFPQTLSATVTVDSLDSATVTVSMTTTFTLIATSVAGADSVSQTITNVFDKLEPNDTATAAIALVNNGGVNGSISPAGDVDFYSVTIPAGGWLVAETSDGNLGCTTDTRISVYNSTNTIAANEIAEDDDDGPGTCSMVTPFSADTGSPNPALGDMAAGTYYIRVRGFSAAATTGDYTLTVRIGNAACGNTLVEGAEQCDDGNNGAGDGCDANCQIESAGTLSGPGVGIDFTGAIVNIGQAQFYQIVMAAPGYIGAETFAPTLGACQGVNTEIFLLDSTFAVLGSDDFDGINSCSRIDAQFDAFASVPAGTYWIRVEENDNNNTIDQYVLSVQTIGQGCGNGIIEPQVPLNEICDDGNTVSGDGCSAACQFEGIAEAEPNNTFDDTGVVTITADGVYQGSISPIGDEDYYAITVPANYHLDAFLTVDSFSDCPVNPEGALRLYDTDGVTQLQFDNNAGPSGNCGRIYPDEHPAALAMAAGTYFLRVDQNAFPDVEIASYFLHVSLIAPGCGNGILDVSLAEQCDDGNTTAGDGCSAACAFEIPAVINPPSGTASLTIPATQGSFQLVQVNITTAGQSITATAADAPGATTCDLVDTAINLGNDEFALLGGNAGQGPVGTAGECGAIRFPADAYATNLDVGTYFVAVINQGTTGGAVDVTVAVIDPVCGDSVINTGEQCDDGNTVNGDGCTSQCAIEPIAQVSLPGAAVTVANGITVVGQADFVQLNVTADTVLLAQTYVPDVATGCVGGDTVMRLLDDTFAELAENDDSNGNLCSTISQLLTAGTYYLEIIEFNNDGTIPAYELVVEGLVPGIVEVEVNDTQATANSSTLNGVGIVDVAGANNPLGDDDVWSFVVPAGQNLTFSARTYTTPGDPLSCTNTVTDTRIIVEPAGTEITTLGTGTSLAENDDLGGGPWCSEVTGVALGAGTYYVRVQGWNDNTITSYQMRLELQ